jgi:putative PIG3 family NAD(P)H quinone oxidoreductase
MRAVDHGQGGDVSCLTIVKRAVPQPGPGQVLIEVVAAGINRPDIIQRLGLYPPPAGASPVLGLEVAGRIAALGDGVTSLPIGSKVCSLVPGGGYAEFCVAPAAHVLPIPRGLDFTTAAALPETWFTVWANLIHMAHLSAGQRLLVHGGSSGIGLTAIQLARHLGAECLVTVGSDGKAVFCREFGATEAINYRTHDFADEVARLTGGQGVDVVLDMVGAPYFQRNLAVLRKDGKLVSIAFLNGSRGEVDLMPIMLKRLTVTGSTMRPRSDAEKSAIRDALLREIWPAIERGDIRTHVERTFPLAEVAAAHRLMESSTHIGKLVLAVRAG